MTKIFDELNFSDEKKIAVIENGHSFSYLKLRKTVQELASFIEAKNLPKGSRIGIPPMSALGFLISVYACQIAGKTPVAMPFKDGVRRDGAIAQAKIASLMHDPIININLTLTTLQKYDSDNAASLEGEALIIFTSGTTSSKLKGVRLSHDCISSACAYMNDRMQVGHSTCELVFASLEHAFGFGRCHSILSAGGTLCLTKKLFINELFELVEQQNCNALSAPPSILASIMRLSSNKVESLATRIKLIQTGAMRFDLEYRKSLVQALPKTRVFVHYGLSEAMRATFFELNANMDKAHTEGVPSNNVQIKIFDQELKPLPPENEGLIGVSGKHLCLGYLDDELWRKNIKNGFFITSDRGVVDQDGFLEFRGRSDDVINANGTLIHPDEIEQRIRPYLHPVNFSVVGIRDPQSVKDNLIVLCVQRQEGLNSKKVCQKIDVIENSFKPNRVVFLEEIPQTRSGKVNRRSLRSMIEKLKS